MLFSVIQKKESQDGDNKQCNSNAKKNIIV